MGSKDPLLQPLQIRHLTLKNRVVSTPHAPAYAENGMPKLRYQLYHEEKAKGGIGMTMFGGSSFVAPDTPSVFGQIDVSTDDIIPYFQQFSERIHRHDCGIICQISHLGRRTTWNAGNWLPVIAPSRVKEPAHRAFPREMDRHDIKRVIKAYAAAALRCQQGGLDGTEILSHGHLPEQFLSPATNFRTDEYGGSLRNRLRFTLELLEEVRQAVGSKSIIGIRLGATEDWVEGFGLSEGIEAAQIIEESRFVDYMTVNFGHIDTHYALAKHIPGMWAPLAPWLGQVQEFRKYIKLPLIHACRIAEIATARHAITEGILDLVGMTRAHIADPHIVRKITEKKEHSIRPCVGASYCLDRVSQGYDALCLHNAATGREATMPHVIPKTAGAVRKIVVVGGGPAGMEAARVCASRGHHVTMFEASGKLGGQLQIAALAGWRRDLISIVDWYAQQLEELGVDIRWNTMASDNEIEAENPDIVIAATGGIPDMDFVPGGELAISVWDALTGPALTGDILVYDDNGQPSAPSCADHLAGKHGAKVEYVTPDRAAASDMGTQNFSIFLEHFYRKGVTITPDSRLSRIERHGNKLKVTFSNEYGGPDIERIADHVIVEHGTIPADEVFTSMRARSRNDGVTDQQALLNGEPQKLSANSSGKFMLFRVGDAVASRNIHAAIYDSLRLCKDF
ncbi:FAD-dependent oxidoreductase [Aestuariivirga sp.]|uniref:oxidoreductase n=1 Tax=Aestuariivirga sp. TaxID=2650926 RepID=UPI0039E5F20C